MNIKSRLLKNKAIIAISQFIKKMCFLNIIIKHRVIKASMNRIYKLSHSSVTSNYMQNDSKAESKASIKSYFLPFLMQESRPPYQNT